MNILDFDCTTKNLLHLKKSIDGFSYNTDSNLDDSYVGTWERIFESGTSLPSSTKVIWLQTHKFFADIRIPAGSRELQQSFAGHTVIKDDRGEWHQWCSLSNPVKDTARLEPSVDGSEITEYCDDGAKEIWKKQNEKIDRIMSLQFIDEQAIEKATVKYDYSKAGKGFFLVVGDDFMRVLDSPEKAPYESVFGKISTTGQWIVSDSTAQSLEGQTLYDNQVMCQFGDIILEKIDSSTVRRWLVHEMDGDIPIILE